MKLLNRRATLKGMAGITLALPFLEIMANEKKPSPLPKRFCALYTANGMSFPQPGLKIPEWHWFPRKINDKYQFSNSTKPFEKYRHELTFFDGLRHLNGTSTDPHSCSDMWLTGAPFHNPKPGTYNTVSMDQVIAKHTKKHCRLPSLVLSVDGGVGYISRTATASFDYQGRPIPAENSPQQIFKRLFLGSKSSIKKQRALMKQKMKLVDAVLENSKDFNKSLGKSDKETMDQYLTSLNELENRINTSERWIDIPLKKQDYSQLNFNYDLEKGPADFYQVMFDLIALAFDADITRSVTFMLNREDSQGISDTFPLKLGLGKTHHALSHSNCRSHKKDMITYGKYDLFLSEQVSYFLDKLKSFKDVKGNVLDNSYVLYGSGCSTTHLTLNMPSLLAGGKNMGIKHSTYFRNKNDHQCNLYLSIMKSMGLPVDSFGDSSKPLEDGIFNFA
ncbi:MAG: DUF1552 domain-containing protein [Lentisphaeraceae bacterium]|nr:DUF1552 domain-containing protein [Lentisphaeraceae bacterium]